MKKMSVRTRVIFLIVSASILLSACSPVEWFRGNIIKPWQEQKNIPTQCSTIC